MTRLIPALLAILASAHWVAAQEATIPGGCHAGSYAMADGSYRVVSPSDAPNLRYRALDGRSGRLYPVAEGRYADGCLELLVGWILAARPMAASQPAAPAEQPDLAPFFEGVEGTFVLLDAQTGRTLYHDAERARRRYLPASTYKIANALIALETGVADGPDFDLQWDGVTAPRQPWWPEAWNQPRHSLRSALQNSVVWYYQELARRIGPDRMRAYVERFGYGNRDTSGGIDRFWLDGGLRISADEQVEFLRRFHSNELGASERSTRIVKDLLVLEDAATYRLSGKTGWAGFGEDDAPQVGWLVGYVERAGDVHFFALNLDIREGRDAGARMTIVRAILSELGLIGS